MIYNLKEKILNLNVIYYFILIFFIQLIPSIILMVFNVENTNTSVNIIEQFNNIIITFLFVVVWGPIFETVIFQFILINLIKTFTQNTKYTMFLSIVIPSIVFGSSHPYNIYYFAFGTIIGLVYSSTYYISQFFRKENGFIIVLLLHSSNNLLAFLTN